MSWGVISFVKKERKIRQRSERGAMEGVSRKHGQSMENGSMTHFGTNAI
jgi:hypothetical protein